MDGELGVLAAAFNYGTIMDDVYTQYACHLSLTCSRIIIIHNEITTTATK